MWFKMEVVFSSSLYFPIGAAIFDTLEWCDIAALELTCKGLKSFVAECKLWKRMVDKAAGGDDSLLSLVQLGLETGKRDNKDTSLVYKHLAYTMTKRKNTHDCKKSSNFNVSIPYVVRTRCLH